MAAGGSLVLGCMSRDTNAAASTPAPLRPNAWIRINTDASIIIALAESEMGQGVLTAMPMLVAEELEADWTRVRVEGRSWTQPMVGRAPVVVAVVRDGWRPLREAGAAARAMLIAAATRTWKGSPAQCRARDSVVFHAASWRRTTYGELAAIVAGVAVPNTVQLKDTFDFRVIRKSIPRLDTPAKVDGSAVFGMDV